MWRLLLRFICFPIGISMMLMLSSVHAQSSQFNDHDPLQAIEQKSEVFPLARIAECDRQGVIYQSDDLDITLAGSVLRIDGHGVPAHGWETNATVTGIGCEIFQADLDGSGRQSLVIRIPGIGSSGSYGTRLAVLLFDSLGRPVPWSATGRFDIVDNGIRQVRRMSNGQGIVLHSFALGHPAWGGVSYDSELYEVIDSSVRLMEGSYAGEQFPYITGARSSDKQFLESIRSINLSTEAGSSESTLSGTRLFVRFGSATAVTQGAGKPATVSPEQGANLMIDATAVANSQQQVILSDGTKFEIPDILVVDSVSGFRKVIFSPEDADLRALEKGKYSIRDIGKDCFDSDDCHPNILRAIEQK